MPRTLEVPSRRATFVAAVALAGVFLAFTGCGAFEEDVRASAAGEHGDDAGDGGSAPDASSTPSDASVEPHRPVIVVAGGDDDVAAEVFWSPVAPDGTPERWRRGTLPQTRWRGRLAAVGGRAVFTGGDGPMGSGRDSFVGELEGDALVWRIGSPVDPPRGRHVSAAVGVHVLVMGGGVPAVDDLLVAPMLADGLGAFAAATPPHDPRTDGLLLASRTFAYLLTGSSDGSSQLATGPTWRASVDANGTVSTWTQEPSPGAVTLAQGAATATHLYVTGGFGTGASTNYVRSARIGDDGALGAWTELSAPQGGVRVHGAMVHVDGRLYLVGGEIAGMRTAVVDVADIRSDGSVSAWRQTTPLPATAHRATAAALVP